MNEFWAFLQKLHRVIGASHGTPDDPLHAKWVDHTLRHHEHTWPNLRAFQEWKVDIELAA